MIIWINGAFGAGKTTLANQLRERRPDLLLFDPEEIGFLVRSTVPPAESGDFQDLPLWRSLTIATLVELRRHYDRDIVVPMTLVRPDYLDEILTGIGGIDPRLVHVYLNLEAATLRGRIERQTMHPDPARNSEIRRWRLAQVDRCLAARAKMPGGTWLLDSGAMAADDLAELILAGIGDGTAPLIPPRRAHGADGGGRTRMPEGARF